METKYSSVLKTLLDEIRAGKYRDSEFPSENMSARRFAVGRKTVIKVYDELVRRGLVKRRRGARTALTRKAAGEFGRIGLIVHGSDYCELFAPIARRVSHLCQLNGLALLFADLSGDAVARRIDRVCAAAEMASRLQSTAEKGKRMAGVILITLRRYAFFRSRTHDYLRFSAFCRSRKR